MTRAEELALMTVEELRQIKHCEVCLEPYLRCGCYLGVQRRRGIEEFEARVTALTKQRDDLLHRLLADPDRAAVATVDGLTKLLREDEALGRLLDWVGVAAMDSLSERLLFLCAEYLSRTGQVRDVDAALALGRDVLAARPGPISTDRGPEVSDG